MSSPVYQVMKVQLPFGPEPLFVSRAYLLEDIEESLVTPQGAVLACTGAQLFGRQVVRLDVVHELCKQPSQPFNQLPGQLQDQFSL